jgi:hypothetical protein
MHVVFLFDVVVCWCIFYNMILDGRDLDIKALMVQLKLEKFASCVHQIN